jgi:hypothetical protein
MGDFIMPILEKEKPLAELRLMEKKGMVCEECGANVVVCWGGAYGYNQYILKCSAQAAHNGVVKPYAPSADEIPGFNLYKTSKKGREQMVKEHGNKKATALAPYRQAVLKTKEEAKEVLDILFPGVPAEDAMKAALICVQYELNPLMKHVFLIPFKDKDTGKRKWATVLGIQATRLIAHRAGDFSYVGDTPRMMTDEEQKTIFGEVMDDRFWAITKLKDGKGNEAQGYGFWLNSATPYGMDKGNTRQNMAFIRSERQALDRLYAGKLPQVAEVLDAQYMEVKEAEEAEETEAEEGQDDTDGNDVEGLDLKADDQLTFKDDDEAETSPPVTPAQLKALKDLMEQSQVASQEVGKFCNKDKGWKIKTLADLNQDQYKEVVSFIKKDAE